MTELKSLNNLKILDPDYNKNPICYDVERCKENNKLWHRKEPLDDVKKEIILDPRPESTAKSNLKNFKSHYQAHFPERTETFIKPANFNNLYCHQKFKRINDESFLLNINKKADKYNTFNAPNKIVKYNQDTPDNNFAKTYLDSNKSNMSPAFNKNFPFNESTRRKIIGQCGSPDGRQWCKFDDYDKHNEQERNYNFKIDL
jgi:hypothetical protein